MPLVPSLVKDKLFFTFVLVIISIASVKCFYTLRRIQGRFREFERLGQTYDSDPDMALKFVSVAARAKHSATVIFVHGLGDTGYGWAPIAEMFSRDPALAHVKWVLPHAPVMPVTANMGAQMPSWFDIPSFDFKEEDEPGMLKSMRSLNELITTEVDSGIPAERVVLGGFSQGGAMSLLTGLTTERKLGGVVVLSGWLPLRDKFKVMASDHVKKLPIFWGHGRNDPLVRFQWGSASEKLGVAEVSQPPPSTRTTGLEFHGYSGVTHSTSEEELDDLRTWISKTIPQES
ncbi:hypothetical protein NLI96_g3661 [Meripilus lineatus]|uniref:Acyl-protein thioesterase 1 n=1 Tax=Meripilus lineatus TaxID=2056292 RepID=A0AAD5VBS0_9APHY|nr:hypothetical protein NLI96_g3661 [Physisporinus lineatus]